MVAHEPRLVRFHESPDSNREETDMTTTAVFYTEPNRLRDYLAGESIDKVRTYSKHQGHVTTCSLIHTHDGEYHLVPNATVIAAVHFDEPGETHDIAHGEPFVIDNAVYAIVDDKPFHNPRIVPVPACFRPK